MPKEGYAGVHRESRAAGDAYRPLIKGARRSDRTSAGAVWRSLPKIPHHAVEQGLVGLLVEDVTSPSFMPAHRARALEALLPLRSTNRKWLFNGSHVVQGARAGALGVDIEDPTDAPMIIDVAGEPGPALDRFRTCPSRWVRARPVCPLPCLVGIPRPVSRRDDVGTELLRRGGEVEVVGETSTLPSPKVVDLTPRGEAELVDYGAAGSRSGRGGFGRPASATASLLRLHGFGFSARP